MKAAGGGSIVNTASNSGTAGDLARIAYGSTKGAIITLTRYVATQHGSQNIRCNSIAPGVVLTEALDKLPKVSGQAGNLSIGNDLSRLLNVTDKLAQDSGDTYIASEWFLLAALDDATLHEYLEHADLQAKTSRTVHDPAALLEILQQVREQGWCVVDQELEQGLRSIAVPVYDASGQVLAALNISTHAGRVSRSELEQRFLPGLLNASRDLSAQLFA